MVGGFMATRLSWVAFSNLLRKSKIFLIDTLSDKSSFLIRASLEMALNYFVSKQAPFEKTSPIHPYVTAGIKLVSLYYHCTPTTTLPLCHYQHWPVKLIAKGVGMILMVNNWRNWTTAVPRVEELFHYHLMMRVWIPILSHKTESSVDTW